MPFDLFISYSRRDDQQGRVTALKEQLEADYRSFAMDDLRCFFDVDDIRDSDDWRHRILEGLRDSNLLLLVLSPAYLSSPYCEWEIVEFLKYEYSRSVGGQGVTPVYFVEVPGLDAPDFEAQAAAWVAKVRRRNHVDLRPWFDEGAAALKRGDVRRRLDELGASLHSRLSRLRRLRGAPGNLAAHNPRFVGREAEMQRLHEATGLGRFGVLTAVQGLGGIGKTALAMQYAGVYADFYPGGRWMVGCANQTGLASALRLLEVDLAVTLSDAEKRDDTLAARRILAELERRAEEGAGARASEPDPPQPKALLLLDNVDLPALLERPHTDLLTGRPWLHVLATTRRGAEEFGTDPEELTVLSIDELPEDDALSLIESYQPRGRFPNADERLAAASLVRLLGGFTLAVEAVAVHLGERDGRVTCAAFLERLRRQGLDDMLRGTRRKIRHGEILLGATLKPTLDLLSEPERLVLAYAAQLPPDSIPLPWLRSLAAEDYPDLGDDAEPGYDDPWLSLTNHLLGLRLLQARDLAENCGTPRVVCLHRVVGEVVRAHTPNAKNVSDHLSQKIRAHCNDIGDEWFQRQWEIQPLVSYAYLLLEGGSSIVPKFVRALCQWLPHYDNGRDSEPILRATVALIEQCPTSDPLDLSTTLSNLGWALNDLGRYAEGEMHLRRALEIDESAPEPNEGALAVRCNQLYACLRAQGRIAEAEPYCRRALVLSEKTWGTEHRATLTCQSNLAVALTDKGDYTGAELLHRQVLEADERVLGPEHPATLKSANNLASLLQARGDLAAAESLARQTLEARERVLGSEHPDTLKSVNNLATLLQAKDDAAAAEPLYRRALEARERVLGPEHPDTVASMHNLADLLDKTERVPD